MPKGVYNRTAWHRQRIQENIRRITVKIGQTFGKRTILEELPKTGRYRRRFKYKCVCGNTGIVALAHLNDGYGCGCARKSGLWAAQEAKRKPAGTAAFNSILSGYRRAARKRGLVWAISDDHFRFLTKQPCRYCGKAPSMTSDPHKRSNGIYVYTGIDRVNNSEGYTVRNSVPCCKTCNYAKLKMTEREFANWIATVYSHFVNDLNTHIDTARNFTAPPDKIPAIDRSQQVNVGVEIAQRSGQQVPPPAPTPMRPIVPIAN